MTPYLWQAISGCLVLFFPFALLVSLPPTSCWAGRKPDLKYTLIKRCSLTIQRRNTK